MQNDFFFKLNSEELVIENPLVAILEEKKKTIEIGVRCNNFKKHMLHDCTLHNGNLPQTKGTRLIMKILKRMTKKIKSIVIDFIHLAVLISL